LIDKLIDKNDTFESFDEAWFMVCALYTSIYLDYIFLGVQHYNNRA